MKKTLSLILSLLMLVSIIGGVSFNALADEVIDIVTLGIQYKPFTGGEIKLYDTGFSKLKQPKYTQRLKKSYDIMAEEFDSLPSFKTK